MKITALLLVGATAFVCTGNHKVAGTFKYFNTGSATGCEHRHHYLYDYRGSDCVWTSNVLPVAHPHGYDKLYATFSAANYGNLEGSDFLKVSIKVENGAFYETLKMKNDIDGWRWTAVYGTHYSAYLRLCKQQCQWRYSWRSGWRQYCSTYCSRPNSNWKNTPVQIGPNDKKIQVKVQLRSSQNYSERHIFDNLTVYGHCRTPTKCATTTCTYTGGVTNVYSNTVKGEKWDCQKRGNGCVCYCDGYHTEKCTLTHKGVSNHHC
jgi:hypothetical protein